MDTYETLKQLRTDDKGAENFAELLIDFNNSYNTGTYKALGSKLSIAHRHLQALVIHYLVGAIVTYVTEYERNWKSDVPVALALNTLNRFTDPRNESALVLASKIRDLVQQEGYKF